MSCRFLAIPVIALTALTLALTGCSLATTASTSTQTGSMTLQGNVHGGNQPVTGAKVYLLATNTSSYGGAVSSLLTSGDGQNPNSGTLANAFYVNTGGAGQFTLTGNYSCTAGQEAYLLVLGGNTGNGTNSSSAFMSILGDCPGGANAFLATVPSLWVNEVTTAAAAYSFAGFATDAFNIGAPSGNTAAHPEAAAGVRNAFATFTNLVDVSTGIANSAMPHDTHSTAPQMTLNTIANILAACVNTNDSNPGNCNTLFANVGGTTPTDTATAAIHLAQHPNNANSSTLIGLQTGAGAPFGPHLSGTPSDYILSFTYTGGSINGPIRLDIDTAGNVWVLNHAGKSITEIAPYNATRYPVAGVNPGTKLIVPSSFGLDPSGTSLWIGDCNSSDYNSASGCSTGLYKVATGTPSAVAASDTSQDFGAIEDLAVAGDGTVWFSDGVDGTLQSHSSSATLQNYFYNGPSGSPTLDSNLGGIAVNGSGVPAIADIGAHLFAVPHTLPTSSDHHLDFYSTSLSAPTHIALDNGNNLWIADTANGMVKYTNAYAASSTTSAIKGSTVAVDGGGHVWGGIASSSSLGEISAGSVVSGSSGFLNGAAAANQIQIDASGNVWFADSTHNYVVEMVGAATPTVTPLSANLATPYSAPASKP